MKILRFFIFLTFLLFAFQAFAQKPKVKNRPIHDDKPLHFGFSLGLNTLDYYVKPTQFGKDTGIHVGVQNVQPGLDIHAIANFRLANYLNIRVLPGISFGQRGLHFFDTTGNSIYGMDEGPGKPYQIEASYLELPVLLKYKAERLNNFSAFFITGANLKYDLAIKKQYDYDEQLIMISPWDVYYEIGAGFDFYLEYFKFSIELKYGFGLLNIFRKTNPDGKPFTDYPVYTSLIDEIYSRVFVISFHFE